MSLPAGAGLSACAEGGGRAPYPHGELRGRAQREPPGGGRRRALQRAPAPGHGEGAGVAASARLPPAAGPPASARPSPGGRAPAFPERAARPPAPPARGGGAGLGRSGEAGPGGEVRTGGCALLAAGLQVGRALLGCCSEQGVPVFRGVNCNYYFWLLGLRPTPRIAQRDRSPGWVRPEVPGARCLPGGGVRSEPTPAWLCGR